MESEFSLQSVLELSFTFSIHKDNEPNVPALPPKVYSQNGGRETCGTNAMKDVKIKQIPKRGGGIL